MVKWAKTRHTGIRYWASDTRKHRGRPDKCYVIRYKKHGQAFSETVGWQSGGITPEFCSNLRGQIMANIKTGQGFQSLQEKRDREDAKKKTEKSRAITLEQAFNDFIESKPRKKTTLREYQRSMNTAFEDWKKRRVVDITRDMVTRRGQKLKADAVKNFLAKCKEKGRSPTKKEQEKAGGAQTNLHMRFLRALFNFCIEEYEGSGEEPLIKRNPVKKLSGWYKVLRRQTNIESHELQAWFEAVKGLKNETTRDFLFFVLFTGSRKTEALTLEAGQVDLKTKAYTLTDTKTDSPITLPIGNYLFKIIENRIKKQEGFKYVFPGWDRSKVQENPKAHLVEPKVQVKKVIEQSKVKFTLHDLRRHFTTLADSLDFSVFTIKRLVNHSIGSDVTSGYVVSDVERLRGPMQKIEDKILSLAGVRKPGRVVPIKSTG